MSARPTFGRTVLVGLVAGAITLAAGGMVQGVSWNTSWLRSRDLYGGLVAVLAILLARSVVDAIARWAGGDRAVPATWFGFAGGAIGLGLGIAMHLDHVFTSSWRFLRGYNSFWELEPETFLAPMLATVTAAVAYRHEASATVPTGPSRLRPAAIVCTILATLLAVSASFRSSRAPTLRDYFDSLPIVGIVSSVQDRGFGSSAPAAERTSRRSDDQSIGGLTLRRYQFEAGWHCIPRLARGATELPAQIARTEGTLVPCGAIELRHDTAHQLYLLHQSGSDYGPGPAAFDARSLEPIPETRLTNARIADRVALPRSWIAVSWILLAMALYAILRPAHARRWLVHRAAWRTGELGADGMVRFDDGSPSAPAPAMQHLAPGKVVVLDVRATASGAPFRDRSVQPPIESADLAAGDAASLATTLRYELTAHEARGLTVALSVLGILAAAASVGLVF